MKFSAANRRSSLWLALVILISLTLLAPAHAAPQRQGADIAQITAPTEGQALAGLVTISGSANHPEFARYELAYGPDPNPNDAWQPFAEGNQPVDNGTLGTWNTSVIADGQYALRLRVIRKDSNYSEGFVRGLQGQQQRTRRHAHVDSAGAHLPGRGSHPARRRSRSTHCDGDG